MIDYILEYMEQNEIYAKNETEQAQMEEGIRRYLLENGIDEKVKKEHVSYYQKYVKRHLDLVKPMDLKNYFLMYPVISKVQQICIEFAAEEELPEKRKQDLRECMNQLYESHLDDHYVPAMEVKAILGRFV